MIDFERNGLRGLKRPAEKYQIEIQEPMEKKESRYLQHVLIWLFAAIIVTGVVYLYGSSLKGSRFAKKALGLLDSDVSLTGIIYSEGDPVAMVNSKLVREGDVVDEVKVVKIHKCSVDFERSGKKWSQSLPAGEEGVHSGKGIVPVLLVLGSEGCPPCRKMKPILKKLKSKYKKKFQVKYIDVWKNTAAGSQYGVRAIPTQIFYDGRGREVFRHVGFYSKDQILAVWREIGVKL